MAVQKKADKKTDQQRTKVQISWKKFLIAASVALNIGLVVLVATIMTSNALDGMLIKEGLTRYCEPANDDKFAGSSEQTIALREYTCERNGADVYFRDGFQKYLDAKLQGQASTN